MTIHSRRTGFTLIELLVVIAIISVIAALTVTATMRMLGSQQESLTQTVMQHVDKALQQTWSKIVEDAKKEDISGASAAGTPLAILAGNDPRRAQVIWIKLRLMEAFPVSYAECNPATNPLYALNLIPSGMRKNISSYFKMLNNAPSHPNFPNSESSACLLLALSLKRGGGAYLNKDVINANILDTDGDGVSELVDAWNTPLFFYRFPTPSTNPLAPSAPLTMQSFQWGKSLQVINPGANTQRGSLFADPLDPDGTLMDPSWFASPNRQTFEQLCHCILSDVPNLNGQFPAFYITPAVISAGANGKYASLVGVTYKTALSGLGLVPNTNMNVFNSSTIVTAAPTYVTGNTNPPTPWPTCMSLDVSNPLYAAGQHDFDVDDNTSNFLLKFGGTGN